MRFQGFLLSALFVACASAAQHDIDVGEGGSLRFSPNTTTAAPGDTIIFSFYTRIHGVAQSTFDAPCAAIANSFFSGVVDSSAGEGVEKFVLTINDTNTIWFYCPYPGHCQAGMVGVINPPSSGNTLEGYAAAAANTSMSTHPDQVTGGVFISGEPSSVSSASPSASPSGSSSESATASATTTVGGSVVGSATQSAAPGTFTGGASTPVMGQFLNVFAVFEFVGYFWLM